MLKSKATRIHRRSLDRSFWLPSEGLFCSWFLRFSEGRTGKELRASQRKRPKRIRRQRTADWRKANRLLLPWILNDALQVDRCRRAKPKIPTRILCWSPHSVDTSERFAMGISARVENTSLRLRKVLIHWLTDWLIDWLIDLFEWSDRLNNLIDWLIDYLSFWYYFSLFLDYIHFMFISFPDRSVHIWTCSDFLSESPAKEIRWVRDSHLVVHLNVDCRGVQSSFFSCSNFRNNRLNLDFDHATLVRFSPDTK